MVSIHQLLIQIIQQIRECFLQASIEQKYHNKWFTDYAWRKIIEHEFEFDDISKQNVNKDFFSSTLCHPLKLHYNNKQITTEGNTSFKGYFYLAVNESTTKEVLKLKYNWNLKYFNYTLSGSNKRRETNDCVSPRSFQNMIQVPTATILFSRTKNEIAAKIGSFWDSTEAKNIFTPLYSQYTCHND